MRVMAKRIFLVLFILVFFCSSSAFAATEKRTALVIGNSNYSSSPLKNPANDAKDMADTLRNMGFQVILKTNTSKKDMGKAIEDFGKQLKGRDIGLFYYAGHGVQVNGANYLIPVGTKINEETDVEYEAVDAGRVLATMNNAKSRVNIVILDACRDNPYARSFRSTTRGLAIIAKAPTGTIISYSTSPGDVALDGKGRNSPYTSSLLQYMKQPGLTVEQVFKNVRQKIDKDTGGKQVPWELSSLKGEFVFIPDKASAAVATGEVLPSQKEKPEDELEIAMAKVREKKEEEERKKNEKEEIYRELASDIKKYRSIKEADIDETLKEKAWQALTKKYPQWTARVGTKRESEIIARVLKEDTGEIFSNILKEEGIPIYSEIGRDGRFIAYDNGTVLDTKKNLMWAARDNGSNISWTDAKSYCKNYRGGGYTDWRMPTRNELVELEIFDQRGNHVTDTIKMTTYWIWVSETRGSEAGLIIVSSKNKDYQWFEKSHVYMLMRALPVRSAK
jgi:hypothetical protein